MLKLFLNLLVVSLLSFCAIPETRPTSERSKPARTLPGNEIDIEKIFESDLQKRITEEELENLEEQQPKDSIVKLRLARLLYCQKKYGESLNSLFWVSQFSESASLKKVSQEFAQDIKKSGPKNSNPDMKCVP